MLSSTKNYLLKTLYKRTYVTFKNPFKRTLDAITGDIKSEVLKKGVGAIYPEHADIVIIGGGFLGTSAAYWLKTRAGEGLNVVVFDKNYNKLLTRKNMPTGIVSQHYSLPENILLSQFSTDFLRNIKENLNKDVDIGFMPHEYLLLASERYCDILERNVSLLKEYGIKNELLSSDQIRKRYPWINTSDVKLGCLTKEGEGTFDSQTLLRGMMDKSLDLGANFIQAEVIGFEIENQRDILMEGVKPMTYKKITSIKYRTPNNEEHAIKFAICVIAAGHESSNLAELANLGQKSGLLSIPLPIGKRELTTYSLGENTEKKLVELNAPCVMDTSGLWLKRNGFKNNLICEQIPLKADKDLSEDEKFNLLVKPSIQNRFPNFLDLEMTKLNSETYDYNTYDDLGIIGPHPYHTNLILATGFGKLGIQQSPGLGRAISDLIIEGRYIDTDLTRLGFDRILVNEPIVDLNVY